jgi:hypothetical protein
MKYLLLMYWAQPETPAAPAPEPTEQAQAAQNEQAQAWFALLAEMKAAGVLLDNNGLAPSGSATTVRVRDGQTLIADGPFAETHEQLGGYFLLNCPDLDEAVKWAAKIPAAQAGSVEVRPLWSPQA